MNVVQKRIASRCRAWKDHSDKLHDAAKNCLTMRDFIDTPKYKKVCACGEILPKGNKKYCVLCSRNNRIESKVKFDKKYYDRKMEKRNEK
jgi:hypothetical protein